MLRGSTNKRSCHDSPISFPEFQSGFPFVVPRMPLNRLKSGSQPHNSSGVRLDRFRGCFPRPRNRPPPWKGNLRWDSDAPSNPRGPGASPFDGSSGGTCESRPRPPGRGHLEKPRSKTPRFGYPERDRATNLCLGCVSVALSVGEVPFDFVRSAIRVPVWRSQQATAASMALLPPILWWVTRQSPDRIQA